MKRLPFAKKWRADAFDHFKHMSVRMYIECNEAWERAKREVELGWPVILLPRLMDISEAILPVKSCEVNLFDTEGLDRLEVNRIGEALIHAGAVTVLYFAPDHDDDILFKPEARVA